jgi:hypothetical protein
VGSAYYLENERIGSMHGEGSQKWGYTVILYGSLFGSYRFQIQRRYFCGGLLVISSPLRVLSDKVLIVKDELCRFCCSDPETVACALWHYLEGMCVCVCVWSGGGGFGGVGGVVLCANGRTFQKSMREAVRFTDIFEYLLHQCKKEDMDLFAITTRSIWNKCAKYNSTWG